MLKYTRFVLIFCALCFEMLVPAASYAEGPIPMEHSIIACIVYEFSTYTITRIVLLIGVIGFGISLFLGKVQLSTFVMGIVGIGVIYGSPHIVDLLVPLKWQGHNLASLCHDLALYG